MALTLVSLVVVVVSDWRTGTRMLAGVLAGAAVLRGVLPEHEAGMLAVRHRVLDVGLLVLIAVALVVLAATIPDQPPR